MECRLTNWVNPCELGLVAAYVDFRLGRSLINLLNGAGSEIDGITSDLNRTRDELQAALF